jgi:hypothetical protein
MGQEVMTIQVPRDKALRNTPRPADRGYMATPPVAGWGTLDDALPDELDEKILRRQIARVFGLRDATAANR